MSIKGPVLMAFYLPMRRGEILELLWDEIDFKLGFILLGGNGTKKQVGEKNTYASQSH